MNRKEEIKNAIDELHLRNRSDFESLARKVINTPTELQYNIPQLIASQSRAKTLMLEWGRGTGKTTFIGDRLRQLVFSMPRSTGLFIGPTYQFILTRILPSLIQGLEIQGLYQNLHYFVGKPPPRSWRSSWGVAYQPPERFDRYITFFNGTGVHLISHDVPGDGRGLNTDWIIGDEAALLDAAKLQENTDPTLRGTWTSGFNHRALFGSKLYVSSTPLTQKGRWFTDFADKALAEPDRIQFISADCRHNLHNLRPGYLAEARRSAYAHWVFEAEYLNVRPKTVQDGFYALLDEDIHAYTNYNYDHYHDLKVVEDCRGDADLAFDQPITLGVDWGATINCCVACQVQGNELRALKNFYALGENKETQYDLLDKFIQYYSHHRQKLVYLHYDKTGNNMTGITKLNRAQLAKQQLEAKGWRVALMTRGQANPEHEKKHVVWSIILKEDNPRFPVFRINRGNCRELWISMTNASVKASGTGRIQKDKSSERSSHNRQYATDLSDAMDTVVYDLFADLLHRSGAFLLESQVNVR